MASTEGGGIYTCVNCGAMQRETYMEYSSIFHGWLCSACKPNDSDTDVPIRVSQEAHKWLLKNRGAGPVKKLIDKLIMNYQDAKYKGDTA